MPDAFHYVLLIMLACIVTYSEVTMYHQTIIIGLFVAGRMEHGDPRAICPLCLGPPAVDRFKESATIIRSLAGCAMFLILRNLYAKTLGIYTETAIAEILFVVVPVLMLIAVIFYKAWRWKIYADRVHTHIGSDGILPIGKLRH